MALNGQSVRSPVDSDGGRGLRAEPEGISEGARVPWFTLSHWKPSPCTTETCSVSFSNKMAKSIPLTHKHTCRPMENKIMKLVYTDSLGAACLVLIQSRTHMFLFKMVYWSIWVFQWLISLWSEMPMPF